MTILCPIQLSRIVKQVLLHLHNQMTGDTTLDVPLHHHAHVATFEHSEKCGQGLDHLITQEVLPEKEYEAKDGDDL
ncbi:hypothetical protein TNCV_3432781 [Trichonephila clavipes]|nr:hypothetical protein TNCV_3432781 [Trichonephila clavipes]